MTAQLESEHSAERGNAISAQQHGEHFAERDF
jgi:hypothetical protein